MPALLAGRTDIEHCYSAHYVIVSWALPREQVTGNIHWLSKAGGCGAFQDPQRGERAEELQWLGETLGHIRASHKLWWGSSPEVKPKMQEYRISNVPQWPLGKQGKGSGWWKDQIELDTASITLHGTTVCLAELIRSLQNGGWGPTAWGILPFYALDCSDYSGVMNRTGENRNQSFWQDSLFPFQAFVFHRIYTWGYISPRKINSPFSGLKYFLPRTTFWPTKFCFSFHCFYQGRLPKMGPLTQIHT